MPHATAGETPALRIADRCVDHANGYDQQCHNHQPYDPSVSDRLASLKPDQVREFLECVVRAAK